MRRLRALIFLVFVTALPLAPAHAQVTEIYKCLDSGGRPLYTSDKKDTVGKKCQLVSREINVVPAVKPAAPRTASRSSDGFPKESAETRASAKERQRDILEKELADEQQKLAQARQELAQAESLRTSDSRTDSYSKVQEQLQRYKDNVDLHQKNIEALRRELAR
jgi:hypothetical protein